VSVMLSEHLPLLASAPNGIQKLRSLILELAVRGKLVPQDPKDEPASEVLKRIAKERARLEADGKIKKSKPLPPVSHEDQPFALPNGWEWVRLSEISRDWGQKTPNEDFSYIDVSAIDNTRGKIVSPSVVTPNDAPSRARKMVRRGTVIYSTVRPYLLNIAVVDRELSPPPIASTAFAVVHPLSGISSQYIFWYLRSPVFVRYVESVQTGIAYPAVNDSQFFSGFFSLAPLAEQHRIVAKVDELMALCDQLEAEQSTLASGAPSSSKPCSARSPKAPTPPNSPPTGSASPNTSTPSSPPNPASTPSSKPSSNSP
jgi:type I restriction enzyme S subunit